MSRRRENVSTETNIWIDGCDAKRNPVCRVYCFPYAGGNSQAFHSWARSFPQNIELCPIQLPGRGKRFRESPIRHMDQLVDQLVDGVAASMDRPAVFFGHSMGSIVSFELAHRLREINPGVPGHLVVSGHKPPHIPRREAPIHDLPEEQFLEELRDIDGTPDEVFENRSLLELVMPHLRADFELIETYEFRERPALDCPITAIGGLGDAEVPREELDAWRQHTNGHFSSHMVPGDHFFLGPSEDLVLQILFRRTYTTLAAVF